MKQVYSNKKIEDLYLHPFGIRFNEKPSLIWRVVLWILGFKKIKEDKQ